jgi:hypothetical protein
MRQKVEQQNPKYQLADFLCFRGKGSRERGGSLESGEICFLFGVGFLSFDLHQSATDFGSGGGAAGSEMGPTDRATGSEEDDDEGCWGLEISRAS